MKNSVLRVLRKWAGDCALRNTNVLLVTAALSFSAGVSADDTELFFSTESAPPNLLFLLDDSASMAHGDPTRMEQLKTAMTTLLQNLEGVNASIIQFNGGVDFTVPVGNVDLDKTALEDAIDVMQPRSDFYGTATQRALWTARSYLRGELADAAGNIYPSPIVHECQQNHIILMTDGFPTVVQNNIAEVQDALDINCEAVSINKTNDGTCGVEITENLYTQDLRADIPGLNNAITHTIAFDIDSTQANNVRAKAWLENLAGNSLDDNPGDGKHFDAESSAELLSAFQTIVEGIGSTFAAPRVSLNSYNESRHRDELFYAQFQSSDSVRWNGNIKKYKLSQITDDATGETETLVVDADDEPLLEDDGSISATTRSLWSDVEDGGSIAEGGFAYELPAYTDRQWYTDYNSAAPFKVTHLSTDLLPAESLGAGSDEERDTLVSWALGLDVEGVAAEAEATANAQAARDSADTAVEDATLAQQAADAAGVAAADAADAGDADAETLAQEYATAVADANAAAVVAAEAVAVADTAEAAAIALATDGNSYYVADSLHNSPTLLSYWAKSDTTERGEILFAANNLGVLHAIDPDSGAELWSYTPEEHLDNIKGYFDNAATDNHIYGIDGEFTLHTAREERADYDYWVEDAWLFMTERRGGNRVYALDVSDGLNNPATNDPFSVMWKITGGELDDPAYDKDADGKNDFADLAQTWSKPEMVRVNFNCPDSCESKELLMFSGGYNADHYDDVDLDYDTMNEPPDSHGNAVYFVDPKTGVLEWSVGKGAQHSLNLAGMNHSIPSTPVPVDTDLDGSIDLMFFVDIGGDVWRVDFGNGANALDEIHIAGGKIAELSPAGQSLRFFNPIDVVISGVNYSTAFFSLVTGSGMRSSPLYQEPNRNRLYSIKDRWVSRAPYRVDASGEKVFDYRYVTDTTGTHSVITADDDVLLNVGDTASTTSTHYGLYRTFELGEKILQPTLVTSNLIFANSYMPPELSGGVNCNYDYGTTRLHVTGLNDGENTLENNGRGEYMTVGEGLLSGGQIIDTGVGDAPFFLIDKLVFTLKELTAPNDSEVFRRFRRTGWVELDEY